MRYINEINNNIVVETKLVDFTDVTSNNETAIFDDEMKSDDVNNEMLTIFVREIIRQLGGNDNHVEDWVIELCRVEL